MTLSQNRDARGYIPKITLSEADWNVFLTGSVKMEFNEGDHIVKQSDNVKHMYYLESGTIRFEKLVEYEVLD